MPLLTPLSFSSRVLRSPDGTDAPEAPPAEGVGDDAGGSVPGGEGTSGEGTAGGDAPEIGPSLEELLRGPSGYVFDGYPATEAQLEALLAKGLREGWLYLGLKRENAGTGEDVGTVLCSAIPSCNPCVGLFCFNPPPPSVSRCFALDLLPARRFSWASALSLSPLSRLAARGGPVAYMRARNGHPAPFPRGQAAASARSQTAAALRAPMATKEAKGSALSVLPCAIPIASHNLPVCPVRSYPR